MDITRHLRQDITYWRVTGSDGFGGNTFAAPTLLKGRWEDKAEQFRNAANEEVTSNAICYLMTDVIVGDFLALGNYTSSATPVIANSAGTVARPIEQFHRTTDLRNLIALRKVYM